MIPRKSRQRQHERHPTRNAITTGVTAVSVAVGIVGGPPGMIAAGVMGAAVGFMLGTVVERDRRRESARNRKLDREIGVTSGTVGSPTEAKRGLDELEARDSLAQEEVERRLKALSADLG